MAKLNVKLTAAGAPAGEFQISGSKEEQDAIWQCLSLIMPSPIDALKKLRAQKEHA